MCKIITKLNGNVSNYYIKFHKSANLLICVKSQLIMTHIRKPFGTRPSIDYEPCLVPLQEVRRQFVNLLVIKQFYLHST